jgi:hypothetical protein
MNNKYLTIALLLLTITAALLSNILSEYIRKLLDNTRFRFYPVLIKFGLLFTIFAIIETPIIYLTLGSNQTNSEGPLESSPYKKAYLSVVDTTPLEGEKLDEAQTIEYDFEVRYFVPEFDWGRLGYEPQIRLFLVDEHVLTDWKSRVINSLVATTGSEQSTKISGKALVPYDMDKMEFVVSICFFNADTNKTSCPSEQQAWVTYKINNTGYIPPSLKLIDILPAKNTPLVIGDTYDFNIIVEYFVHKLDAEFCVQDYGCFPTRLEINQYDGIDEFGSLRWLGLDIGSEELFIGEKTQKTITLALTIPSDIDIFQLMITLFANPERVEMQRIVIKYPVMK